VGWIATGTLAGLIFTIHVVGLVLVHGEYTDPFTVYDAILPGNSISELTAYHCTKSDSRINGQLNSDQVSCAIFPQDGYFDIIHAEGHHNEITELTFYATNVSLGQILLHWKPIVRPNVNTATIGWSSPHYSVDVYGWNTDSHSIEVYGKELHYQKYVRIIMIH